MEKYKTIPLEELKKLKKPVNANVKHKENLTILDKVAIFITSIVGTMWCAIVFTLLALVSLPDAILGGKATIISWIAQTFLQLVLLSVIMVGQNLQNTAADVRAAKTFEDIEIIVDRLDTNTQGGITEILEEIVGQTRSTLTKAETRH